MPEPRDPHTIVEAAEQAAAAGNFGSAEALLREAALVQEARLGPLHPDLANTLNNLGVVCERNGNLVEAERSFRRAFAIATTVLEPDHPFVATSRKNLCDFCEAQGAPIVLPSSPTVTLSKSPTVTPSAPPAVTPPKSPTVKAPATPPPAVQPLVRRRSIRPLAIGALGPVAMLIVILVVSGPWLNSTERPESSNAIAVDVPQETAAPPAAPLSVEPTPVPAEATPSTESGGDDVRVSPVTESPAPVTEPQATARPAVLKARLCADLDEWHCDPPDDPVPPGPLFFYTQVTSTSATTVQHRWYRDDRLNQSVTLRVDANRSGYRTYSRSTMNSDSVGNWKVELRSEDGVLLHEERFAVR